MSIIRRRAALGLQRRERLTDDPQWYKDAIIYELRTRSFADSNGDGIGDLRGLTERLDYLQDLGVTALWLLPLYPSPGRDDGYDISDYTDVHADVGTLDDFKLFLDEAHQRGLRVITELVCNHTSDQHAWFQRARRAPPGSAERDFYVWSDDPERYRDARIIFKDFEPSNWSWDPVAKAYYWHRFFAHQPDLNFESPAVHQAMFDVVDLWFGMGVDGLRLDAVPYLYEEEGTNCENLPKTHAFLKSLRKHVDQHHKNRLLLAEANQWPEDAAAYFGDLDGPGDECHMNFHFPIMPRMYMAIHMEDRLPLIDILAQTPKLPESCQWGMFLRNHDELTLEMVTDEERDYMYRAFAAEHAMRINLGIRRRLAPLLGNDRRNIELMNALLFSLPGTPVLYYGDEIGMGDNVYLGDRNGVRTPMQWSSDRNGGFSRANPQRLILPVIIDPEYHYESLNVEAQQANPNSLLWWTKRLIALRKRFQAFGRGTIEFLSPDNPRVLAFIRQYKDETILVVANLSRFVQYVELDLAKYKGTVPVELLGGTDFPTVGDLPYLLTLGGHAFYWFSLERPESAEGNEREAAYVPPVLDVSDTWQNLLAGTGRTQLAEVMAGYLEDRRWFRPGGRMMSAAQINEIVALDDNFHLCFLRLEYGRGEPETYVIPVAWADEVSEVRTRSPQSVLAHLHLTRGRESTHGFLYDPVADVASVGPLLEAIVKKQRKKGSAGELQGVTLQPIEDTAGLDARPLKADHPNALVVFGNRYLLKFFRKLDEGVRPDVEIGRYLAKQNPGALISSLAGSLELRSRRGEPITIATLHDFVPAESDAWSFTREELGRYFERALARRPDAEPLPALDTNVFALAEREPPAVVRELIGAYLEAATLLGKRTGEMHLLLTAETDDPAFAPESYSALDQRSTYQSMRNTTGTVLRQLRSAVRRLEPTAAAQAKQILDEEEAIYKRFGALLSNKLTAQRTRRHGDFHLASVLYTGKDFVVIDFDGRRDRPLSERRRKRSPLRDVASMLHSFQYAVSTSLLDPAIVREADREHARPVARVWLVWVVASFLRGYFAAVGSAKFLPRDRHEVEVLLDTFFLEKSLKTLGWELEHHLAAAPVSIEGLTRILRTAR